MTSLALTVPLLIVGIALAIGWGVQHLAMANLVEARRMRRMRRNRLELARSITRRRP